MALCVSWKLFCNWLLGLERKVLKHLKTDAGKLTFVSKNIGESRRADILRAFQKLAATQNANHLGIAEYSSLETLRESNTGIMPVAWETFESADGKLVNLPQNAAYFFYVDDQPFVTMLARSHQHFDFEHEEALSTGNRWHWQVAAPSLEIANRAIEFLQENLSATSI